MSFLCDNLRVQEIIFEYKARPLMARVRYMSHVKISVIAIMSKPQNLKYHLSEMLSFQSWDSY